MADSDRDHPLWQLTRTRLVEFVRDPGALFWVFGMPLVLAIALGLAFRTRPPEPSRVAVVDESIATTLRAAGENTFDVKVAPLDEALLMLRRGGVDVLVLANANAQNGGQAPDPQAAGAASSSSSPSSPSSLTYRYDDTRPEARAARLAVHDALERAQGRVDVTKATEERVVEKGSRYIDFLLPGLIGMNLLGSSMWGLGYAIVDARKRKLLKRLAATPMKRSHYLLSLMLSRLVFLFAEVTALLIIGRFAFGVETQGSYAAVCTICFVGGVSFTGLALLIASRTQSTEVASGLLNLAMLPMYLLSGSFFSAERFPEWLQPIVQALPLTALNDGVRAVMNEGATLASQAHEVGILAAWGIIPFALALKMFRWQ